jgi:hypothetical protein
MENPPAVPAQCETIAAADALVVAAVNLQTGIVAEQKGADGAVADKEYISRQVSTEDVFDLLPDPPLRIDRALPAPDTGERMAEELIGHRLELFGVQETRRRTIVLVHGLADLQCNVHLARDDFRRLDRLALAARDDLGRARIRPASAKAIARALPAALNLHEGTGTDGSIATCGWVR